MSSEETFQVKNETMAWQNLTDQIAIDKVMNSAKSYNEANELKQKARARGYVFAMSLYGVLTDRTSGRSEYRRIEILSNLFWTGEIVELIYRFFMQTKPAKCYTIWLYNYERKGLLLIGAFD
jgi:hypothetical protein